MTSSKSGAGYWSVASDGGIFSFRGTAILWLDRFGEVEQVSCWHGGHADRQRLLARCIRRRNFSRTATRNFFGSTGSIKFGQTGGGNGAHSNR